jgi:hypothetical protein
MVKPSAHFAHRTACPNRTAPNPSLSYSSPELLAADPALSRDQKIDLLADWLLELNNRLSAESEGMSMSDPLLAQREAKSADQVMRVKAILDELTTGPELNP